MSDKVIKIDLDISSIMDYSFLLNACLTEDELGCVLRLHLGFERIIDFYINKKASADMLKFIEKEKEFSRKLERAVLLGLPLVIANVGRQLGQIRNKVAHEQQPINRQRLDNLIMLVDKLVDASPIAGKFVNATVEINKTGNENPDPDDIEIIKLGTGGDKGDFILAAGLAIQAATLIVVKEISERLAFDSLTSMVRNKVPKSSVK